MSLRDEIAKAISEEFRTHVLPAYTRSFTDAVMAVLEAHTERVFISRDNIGTIGQSDAVFDIYGVGDSKLTQEDNRHVELTMLKGSGSWETQDDA